jgi:4-hydroxy-tetrahydrodipicolinate synthase
VKYAVSLLGKGAPDMRLPMVEPSESARAVIRKAMQDVGLIN